MGDTVTKRNVDGALRMTLQIVLSEHTNKDAHTHTQAHIHACIHNMHMSIPMRGLSLNQNLKYLDKVVRDPIPGIQVPHPSPLSLH